MEPTPAEFERLYSLIRERMDEMGLTSRSQLAAIKPGGSIKAWNDIYRGKWKQARTLTAMALSLGWPGDAFSRIVADENYRPPVRSTTAAPADLDQRLRRLEQRQAQTERWVSWLKEDLLPWSQAGATPGALKLPRDLAGAERNIQSAENLLEKGRRAQESPRRKRVAPEES